MPSDAGTSDGHETYPLVVAVAELVPEPGPIGKVGRVEAGDVAGEGEVLTRPVADQWKVGSERAGHDVVRVTDEDRLIAYAG